MRVNVTVLPSQTHFEAESHESLLEAGLSAGVGLDYGCSGGSCGRCKARRVSGDIVRLRPHDYVLGEADKGRGYFLLCCNAAASDVVIESGAAERPEEIRFQEIEARVKSLRLLTDKVMLLQLQTPRSNRLRFLAGQSVALSLGEDAGTYAIASCPCDDRNLQFHVRAQPGDVFARRVFEDLRVGEAVSVYGPVGDFVLDQDSHRPILLMACNSGFAPIKSLAEHAMQLEHAPGLYVYWLATFSGGQYMANQCRAWADAVDNFHYAELQAPSLAAEGLQLALRQALAVHGDLPEFDAYVAGPGAFVSETVACLTENGLPWRRIKQAIA